MLAAAVLPLAIVTLSRGLQRAVRPAPPHRALDVADLAVRVGNGVLVYVLLYQNQAG